MTPVVFLFFLDFLLSTKIKSCNQITLEILSSPMSCWQSRCDKISSHEARIRALLCRYRLHFSNFSYLTISAKFRISLTHLCFILPMKQALGWPASNTNLDMLILNRPLRFNWIFIRYFNKILRFSSPATYLR